MVALPSCSVSLSLVVILTLLDLSIQVVTNPVHDDFHSGIMQDHFTKGLDRGKRLIQKNSSLYWTKGIIPYQYSETLKGYSSEVDDIEWVMNVYEYFTPIRFVPWTKTVNKELNLGHDGFAYFIAFEESTGISENCFSAVGNQYDNKGQNIGCCKREKCMHQIGHLLGFDNEENHPDRDLWIRMNWEVLQRFYPWIKKEWKDYVHAPYDISSFMQSPQQSSWLGDLPTYTDLFPEVKAVQRHFYMLKELCAVYKCQDYPQCKGLKLNCMNEGYVSVVNNKCACICPPGLDPSTSCQSMITQVPPLVQMPKGEYDLLRQGDDCPPGPFTKTTLVKDKLKLEVCSRKTLSDDCSSDSDCQWPPGEYCVIKEGNCPNGRGIKKGYIEFFESDDKPLQFCCFENGFSEDPMLLPNSKPFSLFMKNKECQKVLGMRSEKRMIEFYDSNLKGGPYSKDDQSSEQLFACDYTPLDMNCGSIVSLTQSNPSVTIQSDRLKPSNRDCSWLIQAPEKSILILNFDEFDVKFEKTHCVDTVEVKYSRIGQTGVEYCGKRVKHSTRSIFNKMMVRFQTKANSTSYFKATITMKTEGDLCYDPQDRGLSYGGNVSYTRRFEPCIPWKDATPCHHTPFEGGHIMNTLEGNYCRNPDQSFRPWCYTDVKECKRDFCDVCHFEKPYDKANDCDQYDCSQNRSDIVSRCAASCQVTKTDITQKVSEITCSNPGHLKDGILQSHRSSYSVGEKVTYKCIVKDSDRTIERECLTTGQWSAANTACIECPLGFGPFKGHCYRYFKDQLVFDEAKAECIKHGAYLATVLSKEENDFVHSLRGRHGDYLWLGGHYDTVKKAFVWEDGSIVKKMYFALQPPKVITASSDMHWVLAPWKSWQRYDQSEMDPFVCKLKALDKPSCEDYLNDCEGLMKNKGNINCERVPKFNNQSPNLQNICRYTCGLCIQGSGCGGVIGLNENNKKVTFKADTTNSECTWAIHAPPNKGVMVLHFDEFDVEADPSGKCVDVMELRVADVGELGTEHCGKALKESTITTNDTIAIHYQSHANSKSHFKATVQWIPESEWCYKQDDNGFSYGGTISHTQSFKSCVPWYLATKCPHNPFRSKDLLKNLDKNYCRNPDNSPEPWCYTDADTCQREACDVCHWAKPFDRSPLCKRRNKKFCSDIPKIASEMCAATCSGVIQSAPKVSDVTCDPPKINMRGPLQGVSKASYNVGDKATLQCSVKSNFSEELICLTSGQWAVYSTQCVDCPQGQAIFKGKCYKYMDKVDGKEFFSDNCLLATAKTQEKNNFLNLLREPGTNLWLGAEGGWNTGWTWDDKTPFKWTNWQAGGIIKDRLYNCIYMDDTQKWNTNRCWHSFHGICEYKRKKVLKQHSSDILASCPSLLPEGDMCGQYPYLANLCPLTCRDYVK